MEYSIAPVVFQRLHHLGDGGALLADGDIDTNHVAALLVDDGVEGDRRLAGLAVADDQLALSAADRDHGVHRLDAGHHRLFHGLPRDYARRQALDRVELRRMDRTLAVDRLAQRIDHAADQRLAHRHAHDAFGALDFVAFLDLRVVAQQHRADLVFFQVHGDARHVVRELDQFAGHDLFQAVDSGDTVAHRDHRANLGDVDRALVVLDLLAQNTGNFVRSNMSHISFRLSFRTQAPSQRLQLAAHAAVVNRGADPRHRAADQRFVHRKAHPDLFAGQLRQLRGQRRALRFGEFARRGDFRPGETEALVHNRIRSCAEFR